MKLEMQIYDPPSGWLYGFPKPWPAEVEKTQKNIEDQLVKDGYPKKDARFGAKWCRFIG